MTTLSTHVLDIARGVPASGITIRLFSFAATGDERRLIATADTNADGRTEGPLATALAAGVYEITYSVGAYFGRLALAAFFDEIPVRVMLDAAIARYHVPLLLSPWGYSTYRGS